MDENPYKSPEARDHRAPPLPRRIVRNRWVMLILALSAGVVAVLTVATYLRSILQLR